MDGLSILALARQTFAGKSKKLTAAALEQALAELVKQRHSMLITRDAIASRRRAALLDGASDEVIFAIELQDRTVDLEMERLEAAEEQLMGRLQAARSEARRAHWERRKAEYSRAVAEYVAAARTALAAGNELLRLRGNIGGEFGEMKLAVAVPVMGGGAFVLAPEILTNFEAESERFVGTQLECEVINDIEGNRSQHVPSIESPIVPKPPLGAAVVVEKHDEPQSAEKVPQRAKPQIDVKNDIKIKIGADGLAEVDFFRRFEPDGEALIEPGRHRVTPGVALAALRAGAADLPAPAADEEVAT